MMRSAQPDPEAPHLDALLAAGQVAEAETVARKLLCDLDSHIKGLTGLARCALARGDLPGALRWAGRCTRFAPADLSLKAFYAALLIGDGRAAEVPPLLEDDAEQAATPTAAIALGQALARLGAHDRLSPLVARLFRRFPVGVAPLLGDLADHLVLSGHSPGWVAADTGRTLVGALRQEQGTPVRGTLVITRHRAGPGQEECGGGIPVSIPLSTLLQRHGHAAGDGLARFTLPLDALFPDALSPDTGTEGEELTVTLDGRPLLGSPLLPRRHATVEGSAVLEGAVLRGWAWCPGDPPRTVTVEVRDRGGRALTLATTLPVEEPERFRVEEGGYGFSLDLEDAGLAPGLIEVTAGPGRVPLAGSPLPWAGPGGTVRRPVPAGPRPARRPVPVTPAAAVDVVVPVYRGREETLACLQAVLATLPDPGRGPRCELVVIDDATPEPDLARALDGLAAAGRITLLRNDRNLGFPATVNRGLRLHRDRDVVLLNADTLVSGDWLARLRAAAYAGHDVGTVTPLSNDATILSYPSGGRDAPVPVPTAQEAAALDRLAAAVNAGVAVDLPTAVGFCTYIRRDCLEETGPLEELLFGRGYGEENDFCLRARQRGWRHLGAAGVFVAHVGGRSFGRQKTILTGRNGPLLETLHPGYGALVRDFAAEDPLMAARRRLDLARLVEAGPARPALCLVTLAGRGGVARFVAERSAALQAEGWRVLRLVPVTCHEEDEEDGTGKGAKAARKPAERRCRIEIADRPDLRDLTFRTRTEFAGLMAALRQAGVAALELHHLMGHDPRLFDLPAALGVPYDIVVHDYALVCPRVNLVDGSGRYCGEPDVAVCERCTADPEDRFDPDLTATVLRRRSRALVAGARRVTVPTRDVAARLLRHVDPRPIEIRPWETVAPAPAPLPPRHGGRWRICTIGAVGTQKGYDVLLACARDAAARDLPLEFVVAGFSEDDPPLFETGRIFVTGRFSEEEAVDLVRAQQAHLAFLPSLSPETWCYALSTAWRAGLEVAAFDLGALGERIRAQGGHLLQPSLEAGAINDALLGILDAHTSHDVAIERSVPPRSAPEPRNPTAASDSANPSCPTFRPRGVSPMIGNPVPAEATQSNQLKVTAQNLSLTPGFYSLIVTGGGGAAAAGELPLPSVHLAAAPGALPGVEVEMIGTLAGNWLTKPGDTVIVKVTGGTANVILSSYKHVDRPNALLSLQVARIDDTTSAAPAQPAAVQAPQPVQPQILQPVQPQPVHPMHVQAPVLQSPIARAPRAEILAHVQRQGDMRFADGNWAGCIGQRLWIEAFSITPVDGIAPDEIEYKGLTANGWETPWIPGGSLCGSRGLGTPLIGFSVRLRGQAAERFDCHYEAAFVSGHRSAPGQNGSPCRSDMLGDPLEGILLRIVEKQAAFGQPRF